MPIVKTNDFADLLRRLLLEEQKTHHEGAKPSTSNNWVTLIAFCKGQRKVTINQKTSISACMRRSEEIAVVERYSYRE